MPFLERGAFEVVVDEKKRPVRDCKHS